MNIDLKQLIKTLFNPLRLISLCFLYIGYFFGYFADIIDNLSKLIVGEVSKVENSVKNIPMSDKTGKILIVILVICLLIIWFNYLNKESL